MSHVKDDNFELLETISGKWVKVSPSVNYGTFAIELDDVLLTVRVSSKAIYFHIKDDDEVYQYLGDLSFHSEEADKLKVSFFSTAMENILLGTRKTPISNILSEIQDLTIEFSNKQRGKWLKKRL